MNQSSRFIFVLSKILIEFAFVQEDVDLYKSSPPLPGTYCPFHLFPTTLAPPKPNLEESCLMESYTDNSDIVFWSCRGWEAVGDEEGGQHSPSPSNGTRADHPKATRSVARKRQSASQPTSDRYVCSFLLQSSTFPKFSSTCFS